jgi:hypothetical protein
MWNASHKFYQFANKRLMGRIRRSNGFELNNGGVAGPIVACVQLDKSLVFTYEFAISIRRNACNVKEYSLDERLYRQ